MKRTAGIALCFALVLLILTACGKPKPIPEGMDNDKLISSGKDIMALVFEQDYDALASLFRGNNVTADSLKESLQPIVDKMGDFKEFGKISTVGVTENGEEFGNAVIECIGENSKGIWSVTFTTSYELAGIHIVG